MSLGRAVYTLAFFALTPIILLRLLWRGRKQGGYRRHIGERFGRYTARPDRPVIWLHAVSVGETRAAEPLVRAFGRTHPDHTILLTHMTPTGRDTGVHLFGEHVTRAYLPYDLPFAVQAFLRHFHPQVGLVLETELWPNLIHACARMHVPLYLVNARLSERSAQRYARVPGLAREALVRLAGIGAQSGQDAERFGALGGRHIVVTGNLKFDRQPRSDDLALGARFRAWIGASRPVLLLASTRDGEEALVLDALGDAPKEWLCVIVPRHPQRFDDVARQIEQRGWSLQRRSDATSVRADTRVWLGDSMGELFAYYAVCDVAFVGGSLVALGGQNLLEACAVGKPVLVGPHTFNFAEATRLAVAAGAALEVTDARALVAMAATLLRDPALAKRMGQAGLDLMRTHQGATERTLELLGL